MVFKTRDKMEMKLFVDWFENNSMSMGVNMMSNQRFNDVPGPVRNVPLNSAIQA